MNRKTYKYPIICLLVLFIGILFFPGPGFAEKAVYTIGILSSTAEQSPVSDWQYTIDYLNDNIQDVYFKLISVDFSGIDFAVKSEAIDFLIVDPAIFVYLEEHYAVKALSSLERRYGNTILSKCSGIIFTRSGNTGIKGFEDLKGKSLVAVNRESFEGWLVTLREFKANNIEPDNDFSSLSFLGSPEKVVQEVISGKVDAGVLSSGAFYRLLDEGKVDLTQFQFINFVGSSRAGNNPQFINSTRLYPEWVFVRLPHISEKFASTMLINLLNLQEDDLASVVAGYAGWELSSNYYAVRECLKELSVAPYVEKEFVSPLEIFNQYKIWLLAFFAGIFSLLIVSLMVIFLNIRLRNSHRALSEKVVEQARTEEALKESEERVWTLFRSIPEPYLWLDLDGKIMDINNAFEKFSKYKQSDLKGKNIGSLDLFSPFDATRINVMLSKNKLGDIGGPEEFFISNNSNQHFNIEMRSVPLRFKDGLYSLLILHDISMMKQSQLRLERMNDCFLDLGSDINANISKLITLCGKQLGAVFCIYQAREDNIIYAKTQWNIPHDYIFVTGAEKHLYNEVLKNNRSLVLTVPDLFETEYATTDPNILSYRLKTYVGCPVKVGQKYAGVISLFYDEKFMPSEGEIRAIASVGVAIAIEEERKIDQEQLKDAYDKLREAQQRLVQSAKMASVGQLAGGVAHEINNPLTGILNNIQLIKMEAARKENYSYEDFKETIDIIEEAALRCKKITRSLLDFSHVSKGEYKQISLNVIAEKVFSLVENEMFLENIITKKNLDPHIPGINGDQQLLQQAFFDLITNARWAIKKRGVSPGEIIIKTEYLSAEGKVLFSISDNGIGIPDENINKLFEPFFTTKDVGEGTGLGLSMVYSIIKQHGGSIGVDSQVNKGTKFIVKLPAVVNIK